MADGRVSLPDQDTSGSPGNATINKAAGRFAMASGVSAVTITNSLCAAGSHVMISKQSLDATATDFKVVPGSGSFVVTANANTTAAVIFDFFIVSP